MQYARMLFAFAALHEVSVGGGTMLTTPYRGVLAGIWAGCLLVNHTAVLRLVGWYVSYVSWSGGVLWGCARVKVITGLCSVAKHLGWMSD